MSALIFVCVIIEDNAAADPLALQGSEGAS